MFNHERFRELSALASIGQLSSDENRELNEHLRECADCRRRQEDYSRITLYDFPRAGAIRWRSRATVSRFTSDEELRDRFLARARAEGIEFPCDVGVPRVQTSPLRWAWQWKLAVAAVILGLIALGISHILLGHVFRNPTFHNPLYGGPRCQDCSPTLSPK
jgi:predicted anti-sigma-YlaC factor YlaD